MTERRVVNLRSFARHATPRGRIVLPDDVVRVDRGSPWGNPYRIGDSIDASIVNPQLGRAGKVLIDREVAVLLYRFHAERRIAEDPTWLRPLRGKRLACWCSPLLCHADVLVELEDPGLVVEGWPGRLTFGVSTVTPAMADAPAWPVKR